MPLSPGSRLDAYEIVRPLGSGGMGEVWLATEVRLGRKVALKVLPADLTRDPLRVQRFEQEARAASALSHPNVCTIHALGETSEGQHYIAMEYVEGETLRQRLSTTRLTIRESLDIAIQVAAALSAAHAAGIVHRDIKPENVMLRPDGFVKVLDFGLAKLAPAQRRSPAADSDAHGSEDRSGHRGGDRRVHVAGAGARPGGGCPNGHLVAGRRALRDGGRAVAVCSPKRDGRARRDPAERAVASGALRAGPYPGTSADCHEDAAEGPVTTVPDRPGFAPRPQGATRTTSHPRTWLNRPPNGRMRPLCPLENRLRGFDLAPNTWSPGSLDTGGYLPQP